MAACEASVGPRTPARGATSGTAMRARLLGTALGASEVGSCHALTDEADTAAPLDAAPEAEADETARAAMSRAALQLVDREHRLDRVADAYGSAIEERAGGQVVRERVVEEVARAAAEVGIEPRDPEAAVLAG